MVKAMFFLLVLLLSSSCLAVREYDKAYLNDAEMQLGARASERFETNFHIYREASAGANGGKTGGGCGCN
ncbi:MAG: arginine decarboxylase [Flavobacteriia bacterium]|nr:MAG: arginine decarboxylase [Flavobacteriia bacterium]